MPSYFLSPQAQQSLLRISEYTLENYGQQQKKKYLKVLREQMRTAAKHPDQGHVRSDLKEGYYSVMAQKHFIYYRVRDSKIEIIDVLHQSMEPKLHL